MDIMSNLYAQCIAEVYCKMRRLKKVEPFYYIYFRIQRDGVGERSDKVAEREGIARSRRNDFYNTIKFNSFDKKVKSLYYFYTQAV
jgi:hypothetical protein